MQQAAAAGGFIIDDKRTVQSASGEMLSCPIKRKLAASRVNPPPIPSVTLCITRLADQMRFNECKALEKHIWLNLSKFIAQ